MLFFLGGHMAKDDYDVIVYRMLVYLYACAKRKILFEDTTFREAVKKNVENDMYFYDVLRMMQTEGLIEGLVFTSAWGDVFLANDLQDAKITADGIHYLKENRTMAKVGTAMKEAVDTIAKLAEVAGLFVL